MSVEDAKAFASALGGLAQTRKALGALVGRESRPDLDYEVAQMDGLVAAVQRRVAELEALTLPPVDDKGNTP